MKLKDAIPYKILLESVFDKTSLKAVFMAGGPGSGKSYVARGLFGIPEGNFSLTSAHDMKVVNSDSEFEYFLRKHGFDTETGAGYGKGTLDLDLWPPEVWDQIGGDQSPADAKKNPNTWEVPGGYVDPEDENYMAAAIREAKEEVGLDVTGLKELETEEFHNRIKHYFVTDQYSGEIKIASNPETGITEHSEHKWVKLEELKDLKQQSRVSRYLMEKAINILRGKK